jgi:hypothetical protein
MAGRKLPIYSDTDLGLAVEQRDLICLDCPLIDQGGCDEQSLWCAYRWATNPNAAQLAVATFRLIPQRLTTAERSKKWRKTNREQYNKLQRARRAKKKSLDPVGYEEHLKRRRLKAKEKCTT